jgi:hypothetical protein
MGVGGTHEPKVRVSGLCPVILWEEEDNDQRWKKTLSDGSHICRKVSTCLNCQLCCLKFHMNA